MANREISSPTDYASGLNSTDLEYVERVMIQRVFDQVHGDKNQAGKMLGISRATLYRKLKRYKIGMREGDGASAVQ